MAPVLLQINKNNFLSTKVLARVICWCNVKLWVTNFLRSENGKVWLQSDGNMLYLSKDERKPGPARVSPRPPCETSDEAPVVATATQTVQVLRAAFEALKG